eukprot:scaffold40779_cov57-Attheya_sp.AAC.1
MEVWKGAGQHDPIISRNILGCARFIALSLVLAFAVLYRIERCGVVVRRVPIGTLGIISMASPTFP